MYPEMQAPSIKYACYLPRTHSICDAHRDRLIAQLHNDDVMDQVSDTLHVDHGNLARYIGVN